MERKMRSLKRNYTATEDINNPERRRTINRLGLKFSSNKRVDKFRKVIESSRVQNP